jgi:hypothetical protein
MLTHWRADSAAHGCNEKAINRASWHVRVAPVPALPGDIAAIDHWKALLALQVSRDTKSFRGYSRLLKATIGDNHG